MINVAGRLRTGVQPGDWVSLHGWGVCWEDGAAQLRQRHGRGVCWVL